jgi:hypothetical protein
MGESQFWSGGSNRVYGRQEREGMRYSLVTVDTYLNGFGNESTIPIKRSFMTGNFSFKVIQMDLR